MKIKVIHHLIVQIFYQTLIKKKLNKKNKMQFNQWLHHKLKNDH